MSEDFKELTADEFRTLYTEVMKKISASGNKVNEVMANIFMIVATACYNTIEISPESKESCLNSLRAVTEDVKKYEPTTTKREEKEIDNNV